MYMVSYQPNLLLKGSLRKHWPTSSDCIDAVQVIWSNKCRRIIGSKVFLWVTYKERQRFETDWRSVRDRTASLYITTCTTCAASKWSKIHVHTLVKNCCLSSQLGIQNNLRHVKYKNWFFSHWFHNFVLNTILFNIII